MEEAGYPLAKGSVSPDLFDRVSKRIDVNHPTEELRHPATVHGIAVALGEDGPFRTECCLIGCFDVSLRRIAGG